MITDINTAFDKMLTLPSFAPFSQTLDEEDMKDALEQTSGVVLMDGDSDGDTEEIKVYRIYAAAAMLLESIPDLWLIKRHEQTEMNSPAFIIAALRKRQALQDKAQGIIPPDEDDDKNDTDETGIVSYLPRVIG